MNQLEESPENESLLKVIKNLYKPLDVRDGFADNLYCKASQEFLKHTAAPSRNMGMLWFLRAGVFAALLLTLFGSYFAFRPTTNNNPVPIVKDPEPTWERTDLAFAPIIEGGFGGGSEGPATNILVIRIPDDLPSSSIAFAFQGRELSAELKAFFGVEQEYGGQKMVKVKERYTYSLEWFKRWYSVRFSREEESEANGEKCISPCTAEEARQIADAFLRNASLDPAYLKAGENEQDGKDRWIIWYASEGPEGIVTNHPSAVVIVDENGVKEGWVEIYGSTYGYEEVALKEIESAFMRAIEKGFIDKELFTVTFVPASALSEEEGACKVKISHQVVDSLEEETLFGPLYDVVCEGKPFLSIPAWSE
ncbi:hypothetical protein EBT31_06295 [bacterium]|nr:hypothetical protein [bacterium]NBX49230.1 hypothetical protein [bacterium]